MVLCRQPVIISLLVSYNVQKFTERSDNMKLNMKRFEFKRLRTRIPALIVLLGCFTVIADERESVNISRYK